MTLSKLVVMTVMITTGEPGVDEMTVSITTVRLDRRSVTTTYYVDADGDGYGNPDVATGLVYSLSYVRDTRTVTI